MTHLFTALELHSRGLTLRAKAWGDPQKSPILALHGWLDNANSFDLLVPYLSDYYVVALDLPGHGESQHRSADASYHFIDWVVDVAHCVRGLGWQNYAVMGHSMGAAIGCLLASTYPLQVQHLVLMDGLGPLSSLPEALPLLTAKHIQQEERQRAKRPMMYADQETMAALLSKLVPSLSLAHARLLISRGTKAHEHGFTWRSDPRLRSISTMPFTEVQVEAFLRAIRCPTLLIRASHGYPIDPQMLKERSCAIGNLQTIVLPGAHHVHMEIPQVVAQAMVQFFNA